MVGCQRRESLVCGLHAQDGSRPVEAVVSFLVELSYHLGPPACGYLWGKTSRAKMASGWLLQPRVSASSKQAPMDWAEEAWAPNLCRQRHTSADLTRLFSYPSFQESDGRPGLGHMSSFVFGFLNSLHGHSADASRDFGLEALGNLSAREPGVLSDQLLKKQYEMMPGRGTR